MTTNVTVKNENQGAPYADWDVEIVADGQVIATLKPGESTLTSLWHDGRSLQVREVAKDRQVANVEALEAKVGTST